jgi:hypothetical protein
MKKRNSATRGDKVDRHTIGDGHGEENAGLGSDPPVYAFGLDPPDTRVEGHQLHTVHLISQRDGMKTHHLPAEGKPAAHDISHRLLAPKAEIESSAGPEPPPSDTGDDAVALAPTGDFVSGNWSTDGYFAKL